MFTLPSAIQMGTSAPFESTFPRLWGGWRLVVGLLLLPLGLCGLTGLLAAQHYGIPDVRPAYPTAQLLSEQTQWDVRGFHTVRVYRVPQTEMRDVLEWYFDEDIIGRYGPHAQEPQTFDYVFSTPTPAHPLSKILLARYSQVSFVAQNGYIEITSDTHFYWHTLN